MSDSTTKVCTKCEQEKPATLEYFAAGKRYAGGLRSWCRECDKAYRTSEETKKRHREGHYRRTGGKPFEPKTKDGQRKCRTCKQWFPLDAEHFHRSKAKGDGGFVYDCVDCARKQKRDYSRTKGHKPRLVRRDGDLKQCSCCEQWFPATTEFFYKGGKRRKDGLYSECKECASENARKLARAKGIEPRAIVRTDNAKRCPKCLEWKPLTPEFFYTPTIPYCIPCQSLIQREKRKAKGLSTRESRRKGDLKQCSHCYQWLPANTDYFYRRKTQKDGLDYWCIECQKGYILDNKHKYAEKKKITDKNWQQNNKERMRLNSKNWENNNRHKYRVMRVVSEGKRRTRKRNLPNDFTTLDWQRALAYFNHCCAICGRPAGLWHKLAMDHWIPTNSSECPGTIPTNIIPLCHGINGCNNSKADKNPTEWVYDKFGKRKGKMILDRITTYFKWVVDR